MPWVAELMWVRPDGAVAPTDRVTVEAALARSAARWPGVSPSTSATLWWYGSSSTLALVVAAQIAVTGRTVDPSAPTVTLGDTGTVSAMTSTRTLDAGDAPAALATLLDAVTVALSAVPGMSGPSLWAIASDSIAGRALDVATALGRAGEAATLAELLASHPGMHRFPRPRYVDVDGTGTVRPAPDGDPAAGTRRFVRRSSCCLVFEAGESKCVSCPRQLPADRARRWSALVG